MKGKILVIIAIKNEEKHIGACLQSILSQNFPKDSFRVIVVDGISNDKSLDIVKLYQKNYPGMIKIYRNLWEWQSVGRNIAILNEKGYDLIAYIDGHCVAHPCWLNNLYLGLQKIDGTNVAGIGSVLACPRDEFPFGKAVDRVFSSIIGGLGSSYRPSRERKIVTSAPFMLYKREALEKVHLYDEDMKYGEDFSLNYKLRNVGYSLFVEPNAIIYYYKRNNLYKFLIQMYNYGITKAIINKKYKSSLKPIHIVPSIALTLSILVLILSIYLEPFRLLSYVIICIYIFLVALNSLFITFKERNFYFALYLPLLYMTEHLAYSFGFIAGIFKKRWM